MKLLYIAPVLIDGKHLDGVAKKVINHYSIFSNHFDTWQIYYGNDGLELVHGNDKTVVKYGKKHRRYALYDKVKEIVHQLKFDAVYIRYPRSDHSFIDMVKEISRCGAKIVVEVPTYPYEADATESLKGIITFGLDNIYRKKLKKYVSRIVTYSDDETIFEIKTIRTINGVLFDKIDRVQHNEIGDVISLISVATNYDCHGYDRVIRGLETYYKNHGQQEFVFHIVGDGPAISGYKKLIEESQYLSGRVVLEGFCNGDKLNALYNESMIAVNSLALYRLNLTKESTLKTKEYAAKGLPMISSTEVDALDKAGNENYVLLVEDCNDEIDMNIVAEFYKKLYKGKDPNSLAERIRNESKLVCDMEVTLTEVIEYLKNK